MSHTQEVSTAAHTVSNPYKAADDDFAPTQTAGYKVRKAKPEHSLTVQVGQSKTVAELAALDQAS